MPKYFTSDSPRRRVLRRTLARLLRTCRHETSESPEDVASRFAGELKSAFAEKRHATSDLAGLFRHGGIDAVEDMVDGSIEVGYDDCLLLSHAYGVHRLLIDPVLSEPADGVCLVGSFEDFFVVGEKGDREYGSGAIYRTPDRCLAGISSVSLVQLRLEPGGYSDTHLHTGDELLLVLHGSVDLLLLDCGLRARLNPGDFIHFYAEHEHCALNAGTDPAEMFIVRSQRSKRRAEFIDGLRIRRPRPWIAATARREFLSVIAPPPQWGHGPSPSDRVRDRAGLGRFLQLVCESRLRPERRLPLKELARRGAPFGISRAKFDRIHHGLSPVSQDELLTLAKIYEVAPVLLYHFLCPTIRGAIAVRSRPDPNVGVPGQSDMRPIPGRFLPSSDSVYRIPCRRLADTDVAIASLVLPFGMQTPMNRHPGHEVIVPLVGEVIVRFKGGLDTPLSADRGEFAHFRSSNPHWIANPFAAGAEVFVLRVHE
jgi:quercetin dioxygenase-like cupin family protein